MSDRILKLTQWNPEKNQFGPTVYLLCSRVTAVHDKWDEHKSTHRAVVHVMGGEQLPVAEAADYILNELALAPSIFGVSHG